MKSNLPKTYRAGPPKRRRAAFTLVELLVVIGLMGALIVVALPAFRAFGEGSAMRSATAQVRSKLSLARQYAITKNTTTRFVIPIPQSYSGGNAAEKCLKSYAVYDIKNDKYLAAWEDLPQGVVFDLKVSGLSAKDPSAINYNLLRNLDTTRKKMPFPTRASPTTQASLAFIQFNSDGSASFSTTGTQDKFTVLVLSEGSANFVQGQKPSAAAPQYEVADNAYAKRSVYVYKRAGRLKVVNYLDEAPL